MSKVVKYAFVGYDTIIRIHGKKGNIWKRSIANNLRLLSFKLSSQNIA